jgi:hypothetical protein
VSSAVDRLRKRAAAHDSWAATPDRAARTRPGRDARLARLEAKVDPERKLSPEARRKAAQSARRAHMLRISALGVEARRAKSQKSKT